MVKFFYQNLVNVLLKHDWYIGQSKRYLLIVKLAILGLKNRVLFVIFSDFHLIINVNKVKLSKPPCSI